MTIQDYSQFAALTASSNSLLPSLAARARARQAPACLPYMYTYLSRRARTASQKYVPISRTVGWPVGPSAPCASALGAWRQLQRTRWRTGARAFYGANLAERLPAARPEVSNQIPNAKNHNLKRIAGEERGRSC